MSITNKLKQLLQQKQNNNMKTGEEFLAENAKKEGVVLLPSGLQYEVITMGAGEKPSAHNTVTCHYHGTVISGEVFDSSVQRGKPASFPLNAVIKGWTEALQLMPTGSKWKLFLPPHIAYGNRQVSSAIGPNSTLIFEVELISFN
jgi:FKBP-type peptidyl-prolyl cis-trans isomerase FklB